MHEADEQDTCRICSAPAEEDQPLFHPCKCSGTIRYIHQDCLTTWLAHSKKKNCDVCKHPYSFTKVYAPDMPSSLPPILLVRRLIQQTFKALLFVLRGITVAAIWLGVLPWVTVWTWRMYFSMGESTAWWISDRPRPPTPETVPFYSKIHYEHAPNPPKSIIGWFLSHPAWIALSADIFTGQIIASLIVLTFVAVFLLREWISQNARPGVFEEEEPPLDVQEQLVNPQPPTQQDVAIQENGGQPRVGPDGLPALPDADLEQRQIATMQAINTMRRDLDPEVAMDPNRWDETELEGTRLRRRRKHKSRRLLTASDDEGTKSSRLKGKAPSSGDDVDDVNKRRMFHRRINIAKNTAVRRRAHAGKTPPAIARPLPSVSLPSSPLPPSGNESNFTFTFRSRYIASSDDEAQPIASTSGTSEVLSSATSRSYSGSPSLQFDRESSPFPSVALEPPTENIPFSLRRWQDASPPSSSQAQAPAQSYPVRPPLPTSSPRSDSPFLFSPARNSLESPSLSTYRAPEELNTGAGPSTGPPSYFDAFEEQADDVPFDVEDGEISGEEDSGRTHRREGSENAYSDSDVDVNGAEGQTLVDYIEAEHNRYFALPAEDGEEGTAERGRVQVQRDILQILSDSDDDTEDGEDLQDRPGAGRERDENERDDGLFREEEEEEEEAMEGEGLFDDDAPWEEREIEAEVVQVIQNAPGNAGLAPQPLNIEMDPALAAELQDEMDGNVEDDMEGAMEAIGMRGPIYGVLQNAALMIFVLDTAIGLGIWVPFTVGKTTALLTLDPRRLLQVLHLPIRAMRIVTDPIVDAIAYIIMDIILPRIGQLTSALLHLCLLCVGTPVRKVLGVDVNAKASHLYMNMYNQSMEIINKRLAQVIEWTASNSTTAMQEAAPVPVSNATSEFMLAIPEYLGFTEPYFETLGREVRIVTNKTQEGWINLALGSDHTNRVFAIFLGYLVVAFFFCLYLNILTVGNAKSAGVAVRNAVRQQLLVIKVAAFIFIELVVFPLGCGIVLDLCTVWLFPEANLQSRIAFFAQAPLTAMFYHWVAGTMFMYSFAVLLSGCRSVMRSGAMWFIKDPQDQNSHPIRDILDRPTLTQLRKICISGVMYSFVVICVVGSVAGLLLLGSKSIMPFRWKNRESLSNVPVDLLFLHLFLPYTMHYFRPKRVIKAVSTAIWKFLATRLRLTSYFFGGRHAREEYTPKDWRENFIRPSADMPVFLKDGDLADGSFRRVPATDNLALPRDMRATVAVTANGEPVDEEARQLMAIQNAEAVKAKRNVKEDYMIVYLPPYFRYRIIMFIGLLWIIGSVLIGISVALPVQLGRSFFRLFTPRDIHDGYSFLVGFYLLWTCYLTAKAIDRLDKRRQRRSSPTSGPRADLAVLVMKRGLLWLAKTSYIAFWLGIIIPILLAIVVDLYVIIPIRFVVDPGMLPKIKVVDEWALGLLYGKIVIHAQRIQPPNRVTRGLQRVLMLGWTRPDPVMATKEVIAPLVGGLLGMILLPALAFLSVQRVIPGGDALDSRFVFMHVYPTVFIFAGTVRSGISLYGMLFSWSQAIRDKEFLVEMRLRNHEPEGEDSGRRQRQRLGDDDSEDAGTTMFVDTEDADGQEQAARTPEREGERRHIQGEQPEDEDDRMGVTAVGDRSAPEQVEERLYRPTSGALAAEARRLRAKAQGSEISAEAVTDDDQTRVQSQESISNSNNGPSNQWVDGKGENDREISL